jgi:hypothetical protein
VARGVPSVNLECLRVKSATRECCREEFRDGGAHDPRARVIIMQSVVLAPARLPTAKVNMMKAIVQDAYGTDESNEHAIAGSSSR